MTKEILNLLKKTPRSFANIGTENGANYKQAQRMSLKCNLKKDRLTQSFSTY